MTSLSIMRSSVLRSTLVGVCVLATLFCETGCSPSQVTTTLNLIVTNATVAANVLQLTGTITPSEAAQSLAYLGEVSTGVSFTYIELASTDTSAVKWIKISQEFGMIAAPNLPAGTPTVLLQVMQAVTTSILNFLATIQPSTATAFTVNIHDHAPFKASKSDLKALAKIKTNNEALAALLASIHPK